MPPTGFEKYISTTNSWDWTSHCIERVNDALNRNESVTFVNGVGRAMAGFDQVKTWGISRATCNNICNSSVIPLVGSLALPNLRHTHSITEISIRGVRSRIH